MSTDTIITSAPDIYSHDVSLGKIRQAFSGRINLLCIEDNPVVCDLICTDIFRSPLLNVKSVSTFTSARQAIASKVLYHCWILDLTLESKNDGFKLFELKPNFPFCVVVSGAHSMDDADSAKNVGAYSVHDKDAIFQTTMNRFIPEICSLCVLSFILKGCKPVRFDYYRALLGRCIKTIHDWCMLCCTNEFTLRRVCDEDALLTPKQFLSLYSVLFFIMTIDCLADWAEGYNDALKQLIGSQDFYSECADFVLKHVDDVYAPLYLKS